VEATARSNRAFLFVLTFGVITFGVALGASLFVIMTRSAMALTAGIGACLSGTVSGLFYRLYKSELSRVDDLLRDLRKIGAAELRYRLSNDRVHEDLTIVDLAYGPQDHTAERDRTAKEKEG
jgi:hypothetical protein